MPPFCSPLAAITSDIDDPAKPCWLNSVAALRMMFSRVPSPLATMLLPLLETDRSQRYSTISQCQELWFDRPILSPLSSPSPMDTRLYVLAGVVSICACNSQVPDARTPSGGASSESRVPIREGRR